MDEVVRRDLSCSCCTGTGYPWSPARHRHVVHSDLYVCIATQLSCCFLALPFTLFHDSHAYGTDKMAGPLSVDEILAKQRAEKEAAAKVSSFSLYSPSNHN